MDDFELRLVVSSRNDILPPVLQYRKKTFAFASHDTRYYEWSEWESVPIVIDDELERGV